MDKFINEVFTKEVSLAMMFIVDIDKGWWDLLYRNKSIIGGVLI